MKNQIINVGKNTAEFARENAEKEWGEKLMTDFQVELKISSMLILTEYEKNKRDSELFCERIEELVKQHLVLFADEIEAQLGDLAIIEKSKASRGIVKENKK